MAKKSLLLLIVLFFLPCVLANASIKADYQIIENRILVEINLENTGNFEMKIPPDAEALEVSTDYQLENNTLSISSREKQKIKYITEAHLDKSGTKHFFILKSQFQEKADLNLYLPEGAVLLQPEIVFPASPEKTTDGRRIILSWSGLESGEDVLVAYWFVEDDDWHYLVVIGALIMLIAAVYYAQKRKFKKIRQKSKGRKSKAKKEGELTKNLYEEEKQIVSCLLRKKGNEAWTKEILKELGMSKAKLSRKLRSLEAKEVIKRIPYGNENRVRLLK